MHRLDGNGGYAQELLLLLIYSSYRATMNSILLLYWHIRACHWTPPPLPLSTIIAVSGYEWPSSVVAAPAFVSCWTVQIQQYNILTAVCTHSILTTRRRWPSSPQPLILGRAVKAGKGPPSSSNCGREHASEILRKRSDRQGNHAAVSYRRSKKKLWLARRKMCGGHYQ